LRVFDRQARRGGGLILVALCLFVGSARRATAHGGATIDKDPCVQKMGGWSVHFTVYEPQFNPGDEYCVDVPKAGPVIVVFDLVDQELRKTAFELEIVSTTGGARETVHHVAPKVYSTGVINAEATIASPGRYAVILTPQGQPPVVFPLRVEMATPLWVWLVPLVLAAPLLYYWSQRRTPPPTAATDARRNLALVK
jgi:hypothetical protein